MPFLSGGDVQEVLPLLSTPELLNQVLNTATALCTVYIPSSQIFPEAEEQSLTSFELNDWALKA